MTYFFLEFTETILHYSKLREFIYSMQDLMRKGRYEAVFIRAEILLNDLGKANNHEYEIAFVNLLLGIAKRKCGQLDLARNYISRAYKVFKKVSDTENSIRCLLAIGDTWRAQALMGTDFTIVKKNWRKAQRYYNKSWVFYNDSYGEFAAIPSKDLILLLVQILWAQARVLLILDGNSCIIETNLHKAWELSSKIESIWAQEEVAQLLGRYYEKSLDFRKSEHWYKIALRKAKESSNVDRLIESCLYLAKLKKQANEFVAANKYLVLGEKTLSPLLVQEIPKDHQFYKFQREIVHLRKDLHIS